MDQNPEPVNSIDVLLFEKIICGSVDPSNGVEILLGKELLEKYPQVELSLASEEQYYVFNSFRIIHKGENAFIELEGINEVNVVFISSVIASITIKKSKEIGCFFETTVIENKVEFIESKLDKLIVSNTNCNQIYLSNKSVVQDFEFKSGSVIQGLFVDESNCAKMFFGEGSSVSNISIFNQSTLGVLNSVTNEVCNSIMISDKSSCYLFDFKNVKILSIHISREAHSGHIFIENSKIDTIFLDNRSECRGINLKEQSHLTSLHTLNSSRVYYLNITQESTCQSSIIDNESQLKAVFLNKARLDGVKFSNSSTCDEMSLESSICGNLDILSQSQIGNIKVADISVLGDVSFLDNSKGKDISVFNKSRAGTIKINESKIGSIDVDGSVIGNLEIDFNSEIIDLYVHNRSLMGDLRLFNNSKIRDIEISENGHCGFFTAKDSTISSLYASEIFFRLFFHNTSIIRTVLDDSILSTIVWQGGSKGEIYMNGGVLLCLELKQTALLKDSVLVLNNVIVSIIQLEELLVLGNLLLRNLKVFADTSISSLISKYNIALNIPSELEPEMEVFSFEKNLDLSFRNLESRFVNNIYELQKSFGQNPLFRVAHSSLGKTEITGCDLTKFSFEYRDSRLLECFVSGTSLPKNDIKIFNSNPDSDKDIYEQKISLYNQLKKLYENSGDIVESVWYHSKSMDNQQSLLGLAFREKANNGNEMFPEEWFNLITFKLNKWSNNHGESIRNALCFLFVSSFLCYCLYYLSIFYSHEWSCIGIWNFIGDYFGFLDITHKPDFLVSKEKVTNPAKVFDFAGKIVIGYSIFQFISAFRRHGKRSG